MNNASSRPQSGKRLFTKTYKPRGGDKKITVDMRPYSASHNGTSPYAQKLTSPGARRKGSARKTQSQF